MTTFFPRTNNTSVVCHVCSFEHIELPANLIDHVLPSNKSNIYQSPFLSLSCHLSFSLLLSSSFCLTFFLFFLLSLPVSLSLSVSSKFYFPSFVLLCPCISLSLYVSLSPTLSVLLSLSVSLSLSIPFSRSFSISLSPDFALVISLADDDSFYHHSWKNNLVIVFGTLYSFLI